MSSIIERFKVHTATIAVIGLGYVGLPLACTVARKGFSVLGFDIDAMKIDQLNAGNSYISHISADEISELRKTGRLSATGDFSRIAEADAIILCVPTPLTRQREPDLAFVVQTTEAIAPHLRRGQLIVLESTTYPGTSRDILRPILERRGLRSGHDFYLAYSPEREDPGNAQFSTAAIPKVVGGDGADALRLACALYDEVVTHTVPVSSLEAAEAVKLTENIFRSVNIALVNELKTVFEAMGIDVWEVIEAAKTKPFGYMPFYPGPGLGGHCIPIDPFYLTWKAREFGVVTRFIELAGEINTAMPQRVVDRTIEALNEVAGRASKGARVLIMGVAYKKNVEDTRESPAFRIMELLEKRGAAVSFHDPMVAEIPQSREHAEFAGRRSVPLTKDVVAGFDATIICTDHDAVDYRNLVEWSPLVIDTRNVCARQGLTREHVIKA
ncbi:MAG: nucleotide sugar dehydrogenase [Reyranella sp.]|uniref:nucleotide sugar dehydrogenase n=1 Tax=Reyranella sp. TaxID=1929291 RepID=UPI002730AEED|nr:nucleotide sugar dehydrogenase [Reyranella sp.]MDP1966341.1 nucleotide sugar dehydrogenase [Reyranella sp.]MDP2372364.1 nucleotide sugar dehydrogenase [Reyranella sp.]